MTLEELEFMKRYPRVPEARVPAILAELKRQQAIADGARRADDSGAVTRPLDIGDEVDRRREGVPTESR